MSVEIQALTLLVNWKGTYNGASSYVVNDGVIFTPGGGTAGAYINIAPAGPGVDPTNTANWLFIGSAGPTGPPGAPGPTGATGATGPPGAIGPAGPSPVNWRTDSTTILPSTTYALNDGLTGSDGSSYRCILGYTSAATPVDPSADPTHWALYAAHGPTGPTGPAGATGPAGPAPDYGVIGSLPTASALGDKGLYVVTDTGGLMQAESGSVKTIAVPPSKWGREQLETANSVALRQFRAALANRPNARCNVAVIGDSIWEGQGATTLAARGINRLAAQLRNLFPVAGVTGGQGFLPPQFASSTLPAPATLAGSPTVADQFGPGLRNITLTGTQTATFTVVGTSCQVVFAKGSGAGTMGVSIDGGAVTNINANQPTLADAQVQFFSFPGGLGTHTVQVSAVSGTTFLDGIVVFNGDESGGITVHDCSHFGTTLQTVAANATYYQAAMSALGADLAIVALGVNDYNGARSLSSFTSDLTTLINSLKATTPKVPSILIHVDYDPYNHPSTWPGWASYVGALYQQALGDPAVAIFDASLRMPSSQLTPNYGLYYTDNVHPSAAGHGLLAEQLAAFLGSR